MRNVPRRAWLAAMMAAAVVAMPAGGPARARADGDAPSTKPGPATRKASPQAAMLKLLKVREAWKITRGSEDVLVGVIDNGFDFYHPALAGKVIPGYYYDGGYHPQSYIGIAHGTMMASIIVAARKGDDGMTGLAPGCRVLTASQGMIEHVLLKLRNEWIKAHPDAAPSEALKARSELMRKHRKEIERFGTDWVRYQVSGATKAIRYVADKGARVINFSGCLQRKNVRSAELWRGLEDAFAYAAGKDAVIVLSAGNSDRRIDDYPGKGDTVIVAGASDLSDKRWQMEIKFKGMARGIKQGSDFGKRLTVMAPAEKIRVCAPHEPRFYSCEDGPTGATKGEFKGLYETLPSGATSSAAPIVSSLAALVLSARPDLGARDVVDVIKAGCDDIGEKGYDIHTGHGRVNFVKTLNLALARPKSK